MSRSLVRLIVGALVGASVLASAAGPIAPIQAAPDDHREGPTRRALLVESEYDAVRVPHHADLAPREQLTIELWVKREATSGDDRCAMLVSKDRRIGYWLAICDGRLRHGVGSATSDGQMLIGADRWHHVAVTWDGTARRFYVDGALDAVRTDGLAPLQDGGADLVIGADTEPGAALNGKIDTVRLWRVARTEQQIREARYQALNDRTGLVAQWPFNGNADDSIGIHDGRATTGATFTFDGVLPRDVTVPLSESNVIVDGRCTLDEYGSAERAAIDSDQAPRIFIQSTSDDLFICVADVESDFGTTGYAAVYLDRNASGGERARPGDYRFSIPGRGREEVDEADGNGGWREIDLVEDTWAAERTTEDDRWDAEFRIDRDLLERPVDPDSPPAVRLAVSISTSSSTSGDRWWPVDAAENVPDSWSLGTLAESPGVPPVYRFVGRVIRDPADVQEDVPVDLETAEGLAGAEIQLLAIDDDRATMLDRVVTDEGGVYDLRWQGYAPDAFVVRESDPRGTHSVTALSGDDQDAEATAPNVLRYDLDEDAPEVDRTWRGGRFIDRVGPPPSQALGKHYIVFYGSPIDEDDLWPLLEAKRDQGFEVRLVDTSDLLRSGTGRDLGERIHNHIADVWEDVEPEPVYALLIGRGDRIPVRDVGWLDVGQRQVGEPEYYPAWPTDWYYADIDSDWDSDGDGFHGEFMRCPPGETYPDPDAEDGRSECPEAGSLSREGPFGTLRGSEDDYQPDVSVGRIPLGEPGAVRRALEASVTFEEAGSADKRRALLAGAMWNFDGSSWVVEDGEFAPGGTRRADPWVGQPWDGQRPFGTDGGAALEGSMRLLLSRPMDEIERLYDTTAPGGDATLAPSALSPDAPLSPAALRQRWTDGRYGFAALVAPGTMRGLVAARWQHDWNQNRRIDQPARPSRCTDRQITPSSRVGPPCDELVAEDILDDRMDPSAGLPPIVAANAGVTGNIAWTWDGVDGDGSVRHLRFGPETVASALMGRGNAAMWVGALTQIQPTSLDGFHAAFASQLINSSLRAGDAHWRAAATLARSEPFDMRSYAPILFGDPALSYWGNAADSTGAWPQEGRDWRATGAAAHSGPSLPDRVWTLGNLSPSSAPVVGSDGSIYAGGPGRIMRISGAGRVTGQATIAGGAPSLHAPALATDGVVLAAGTSVAQFDRDLSARDSVALPGGAVAVGAPRIDGDGVIWVPTTSGMVRITGDGSAALLAGGEALGAATFLPDGRAAWPVASGGLVTWTRDRDGDVTVDEIGGPGVGRLTAVSVSAEGTVYAGSQNGRLFAFPFRDGEAGTPWQVNTGGAILTRPVIGIDGTVYVVNQRGTVVALAGDTGAEQWRVELDEPVAAAPAVDAGLLYVTAGERVMALHLAEGELAWSRSLDGPTDSRSTPVIGGDRTLYVTRADGELVAMRETGWLAAPSAVTVEAQQGGAVVRWTDVSDDEVGFRVSLCNREHDCLDVGTTGAGQQQLSTTRVPVDAGEPFYARVIAIGRADVAQGSGAAVSQLTAEANRSSDYSRSEFAYAMPSAASAPTSPRAEAEASDRVELSWEYPGDAGQLLGFRIRRAARSAGPFEEVAIVGPEARTFLDTGLIARTNYTYRIEALGVSGGSSPATATVQTKAVTLREPDELRLNADRERVILRWRDREGSEEAYRVERRDPGTAEWWTVGYLDRNARFFVDTFYIDEGTYHYRIRAEGEGTVSPWINISARIGAESETLLYLPFARQRR